MLRAVAKHSPELAQSVVDCGALDALVICLEEFDPGVKEAAAWALGYVARHNAGMFAGRESFMVHFFSWPAVLCLWCVEESSMLVVQRIMSLGFL